MCFVLPKNSHILSKKRFFFFKHDFSRKLEGETGLQGVSSNLNLVMDASKWGCPSFIGCVSAMGCI